MVKLDKIYTRGGDNGTTSLGDGQRVKKNNSRVNAFGEVDEANAMIGLCMMYCKNKTKDSLREIQNDLFDIGADLCIPENSKNKTLKINDEQVEKLELKIDLINEELNPLESFILPGGSKPSALLHLSRCIVRRAERNLVSLMEKEKINKLIFKYLNRLSDFLFVAARYENIEKGDVLWQPAKSQTLEKK